MLSRVRGALSSLWPSRRRRVLQERHLRSSSSSSSSRLNTRSSSVDSDLVETAAASTVDSGETNNLPVITSAEAAATALACPTIVESIEFTPEPYTSTVNTPVTTSAQAAATAVVDPLVAESVEFTAETNTATSNLVDTNTAEPAEAWPSLVTPAETADNSTNPADTTLTNTSQTDSGAVVYTSTPQPDLVNRAQRAIARNTLEELRRPANIEHRQGKNALWEKHRNMAFSRFKKNYPPAAGKIQSPGKVHKIKSEPKTPSAARARARQRRVLASIDGTYYPSSDDETTSDEEPKPVAASTASVDRPKLKWPKRKHTISEVNANESTSTEPRKRPRTHDRGPPPGRYIESHALSPVGEETESAVKVAIAARYSPCDVDSEPENSSPFKYRGLAAFHEHLTGGRGRAYSEPPEERSFLSDEMDIDGPSYGESIPQIDQDGCLVLVRPEHTSQNAHHDQSHLNAQAQVDNALDHTHLHHSHIGQAQVDNTHLNDSPLDNAQSENTHPLATPFIKKKSKSPHDDHNYTPPNVHLNTDNEQSSEDESDLGFMIPKAEKDGIAFDFSAERARRWANAIELPDDSWSESEKDLYLRLAMRGFEPLLPAHWQFDFGTLPESLFGEPEEGGEPFFTPSGSSEFHGKSSSTLSIVAILLTSYSLAIKSLASLLSLGGRVRDCGVLNTRPETVIKRGIRSYLRWALRDEGVRATPASIPVHTVYCQRQGESTLSAVRRLDRRLQGLAGRYSGRLCPLLIGFLVCGPIVAILMYDSSQFGAVGSQDTASKFLCQVDLSDRGQDVWNSLALAVAVINVRGQMAGLVARGEGLKREEEEDEDL